MTIEIKHLYWIVCLILFVGYNIFKEKDGGGYLSGIGDMFTFGVSFILYLISWIIWLLIW